MKITDFDYHLDEKYIAQNPIDKRDNSKLLVIDKSTSTFEHKHFSDIIDLLKSGDILVRNNTKVIPARLFGVKEETGAKVEILLLHQKREFWECLVGNARAIKIGSIVNIKEGILKATCVEVKDGGIRLFKFDYEGVFYEVLAQVGNIPLPPYIKEKLKDSDRYQTVYANIPGSAAAPTAGLHFTKELLEAIKAKGVEIIDITLQVGLGTFLPIKVKDLKDHIMHKEIYEISKDSANKIEKALKEKRRIIAVGTTSVRALETNFQKYGKIKETFDESDLFIYPGYEFKVVSGLITNFHLPKSTLLMLVSAFANRNLIMRAYEEAIKNDYKFFSFGDSMVILWKK